MNEKEILLDVLKFHGHKCWASTAGVRVGLTAMQALGVERAGAGELVALVELDEAHCATRFGDGVQIATGCTFGKGNLKTLHYGKWGLTLIDRKTSRGVRVVPRAEVMEETKRTEFIAQRKAGIPPTMIPQELSQPLVDRVMSMPDEQLLKISDVFDYPWNSPEHTFDSVVCEGCGELVVERNARVKDGRVMCIPCAGLA